ncbi:MAG: 2-dehydropantoate 2-reductase [Pseudonocardiales bacterium]|nr:2-dehydropantoate 2-reductase [Pseudonocardia sp.]MDT7654838.1 2-dehydropantoate 2-reductase [Pseudonocardiales bacterium]
MTDGHHRIAILGAGAVGGMLGVLLSRAGHAVTLLTTDRTSTAVNLHGLALRSGRYGDLRARVPARPWLTAPVDILFVAVKAPDLLGALARVPPALVHGAVVVPLLNGIDHVPLMRAVFTHAAVIPMTVAVEATRLEPGVIEHVSAFADYAISAGHRDVEIDPGTVLQQAGLDVDASAPDEATLLWRKLTFLAPLALLTTGVQAALGPAREARPEVLDELAAEATAAATACNARIDPAAVVERLTSLPGSMRSSMLKDSLTGAVLELDAIAGPIMRNAPDGAPVTRSVAGEIARSAAARWPISS